MEDTALKQDTPPSPPVALLTLSDLHLAEKMLSALANPAMLHHFRAGG